MSSLTVKPINFDENWTCLQETVKDILTLDNVSKEAWYKSFNDIFTLCMAFPNCHAKKLFKSTKLLLEEHVLQLFVQTENTANLLQNYYAHWEKYSQCLKYLDLLYHNYNSTNVKQRKQSEAEYLYGHVSLNEPKQMEIGELGLDVWTCNMMMPLLKKNLVQLLLAEIDKLRNNISTSISLDIIFSIINTFIEVKRSNFYPLKFYQSYFEKPFLSSSKQYFKLKASTLKLDFKISKYLVEVLQFLKEEEIRTVKYLHDSTQSKVRLMCHKHLVIDLFNFIQGDFEDILKEERINDMRNTYLLLFKVNHGLKILANIFGEHMEKCGMKIIESLKQKQIHVRFIEEVLDLYKKYKFIVEDVFNNDTRFNGAFEKAFTVIVNYKLVEYQPSKSPEYLSRYCDTLLNKSYKSKYEAEIDDKLLQSITIFKYIDDKDVFQSIYQKQLAKRLILQQSQSMDVEEGMINKLKNAIGYEFTSKLHQMLTDIRVSDGLNAQLFSEQIATNDLNVSFSTYVLQTGAWPVGLTNVTSFVLPKELIPSTNYFETFYKGKFHGRKLTWLHHQSHGELKLNYLQNNYVLILKTIQMSILLLFNDCDTLKFSDISNKLQLSEEQSEKDINSLVECKLLLLDDDNVTLNMEFTNKRTKILITSAVKKKRQEIVESVNEDRKLYLQATIIRIMKARKRLRHTQLVNEIFSLSNSFLPTTTLIKSSIELLIHKEYLERSLDLFDEYNYVA